MPMIGIRRAAASAAFGLSCLALAQTADAAAIIDTTGYSYGNYVGNLADGQNLWAFGQTFTVTGPETQLDSFTFRFYDGGPFELTAHLYAWNGSYLTGPALYTSALVNLNSYGFIDLTFDIGGVELTAGDQYAMFLSIIGFTGDADFGAAVFPYSVPTDIYAGGGIIYAPSGANFAGLFTITGWGGSYLDMPFRAEFSTPAAVPEPATLTLFGAGLAGLALAARRRRP